MRSPMANDQDVDDDRARSAEADDDAPGPHLNNVGRYRMSREMAEREEPEADDPGRAGRVFARIAAYQTDWTERWGPADVDPRTRVEAPLTRGDILALATKAAGEDEHRAWFALHSSDELPTAAEAAVIKVRIAERAAADVAEWEAENPTVVTKARKSPARGKRRNGGSKARGDLRVTSAFRKVPAAITDSQRLSGSAVRAANVIARSTNVARWNLDLRCDLPYSRLADRMGKSVSTAQRAIRELVKGGYFPEVPHDLNRGGIRYHLYGPCTNPRCWEGLRSKAH
jgi:hypothetical protein